jgi:hypothetical protein
MVLSAYAIRSIHRSLSHPRFFKLLNTETKPINRTIGILCSKDKQQLLQWCKDGMSVEVHIGQVWLLRGLHSLLWMVFLEQIPRHWWRSHWTTSLLRESAMRCLCISRAFPHWLWTCQHGECQECLVRLSRRNLQPAAERRSPVEYGELLATSWKALGTNQPNGAGTQRKMSWCEISTGCWTTLTSTNKKAKALHRQDDAYRSVSGAAVLHTLVLRRMRTNHLCGVNILLIIYSLKPLPPQGLFIASIAWSTPSINLQNRAQWPTLTMKAVTSVCQFLVHDMYTHPVHTRTISEAS